MVRKVLPAVAVIAVAGVAYTVRAFTLIMTIPVTTCADNVAYGDGACSLREAVMEHHKYIVVNSGGYVSAECPSPNPAPGPGVGAIVTLPECTFTMALAGTGAIFHTEVGDIDVYDQVTFSGMGPDKTILDANHIDRMFSFWGGAGGVAGMTIRNGETHSGGLIGGAIYSQTDISISNVVMEGNAALGPGGGGAILCNDLIYPGAQKLTMNRVTMIDNSAPSGFGGGGISSSCAVDLNNVTMGHNSGFAGGGATLALPSGLASELHNVTIADNSAEVQAGGLWFSIRKPGTVTIDNVVMLNNTVANGDPDCRLTSLSGDDGTVPHTGTNFVSVASACVAGAVVTTSSDFGPLRQINGSPHRVYPLRGSHPAIDTAACDAGISQDVRGAKRPVGSNCDAGSFERQDVDLSIALTAPGPIGKDTPADLSVSVTAVGGSGVTEPEVAITLPSGYTYNGANGANCSATGVTVTCTLPDMAVGASTTFSINITGPGGIGTFSAHVVANWERDIVSANDTSTVSAPLAADLALSAPSTLDYQQPITLTLTNNGPQAATGATVTLSSSVIINGITPSVGTCTASECVIGSLAVGATVTFTVNATFTRVGSYPFNYAVSSGADPIDTNNSATTNVVVGDGSALPADGTDNAFGGNLSGNTPKKGCGCGQAPIEAVLMGVLIVALARARIAGGARRREARR